MMFFGYEYALLALCWTALFAGTESILMPNETQATITPIVEDTTTTLELRAENGAHLTLKRQLASADTFSGSFYFLSERSQSTVALLTVLDAETLRLIAKCLFNNRPLGNNINKNIQQQQTQWLLFEWRIEGGLLQCHTPESETFFKLNDAPPAGFKPVVAYTLEIPKSNATLCLRDLKTSEAPITAMQCPSTVLATVSNGVQCGCSHDGTSFKAIDTILEFPPANNNSLATQIRSSASSERAAAGVPLPSPVVFPMFRPVSTAQHADSVPRVSSLDASFDNTAPIFDHLKVSESSTISINAQSPDVTTLSLRRENSMFTLAPEIWIRATRPPFNHDRLVVGTSVPEVLQATSVALTTNADIVDISDLRAINAKITSSDNGDHSVRDDSLVKSLSAAERLECKPECKMGGVCVISANVNVCNCPAGLLGRNCNIRNPCANALTCTEHYGPAARCIVNEEIMAQKAPPLFVEAPHICVCRDDYNEWNDCDELFKMEFGSALAGIVPAAGMLANESFTTTTTIAAHTTPVNEFEAFSARESFRVPSTENITDDNIAAKLLASSRASNSSSSSDNTEHSQFFINHNVSNSTASSSSSSSETAATIFTRFPGFDTTNSAITNSSTELFTTPSTILHLVTPSSVVPVRSSIANTSTTISNSPRAPVAVALPIPGEDNETTIATLAPLTTPSAAENIVTEITPTTLTETEGDNGFERITQHIHTILVPTERPEEFETNLTEEDFAKILPVTDSVLGGNNGFVSNEDHGVAFTNNFITPDVTLPPEAEAEEDSEAKPIAITRVTPRVATVAAVITTLAAATNGVENVADASLYRNGAVHRSVFQSSVTSWIIGVAVLCVVLILLAAGGACVGRYVRRSRRLHGKYNPSREESALATAYAMPMTSVSKEERLI